MARVASCVALLSCLLGAGSAAARAPLVLVVHGEGAPLRPGLIGALRVQLVGAGTAADGGAIDGGPLAERVAAASAHVRDREALLSLWVESEAPRDGERRVVLYMVGPREGSALFEVMRLPDGSEADVDRSLALKVREVFDRVQRTAEADALAGGIAPLAPQAPSPSASSRFEYGVAVSLGGLWSPSLDGREPSTGGLEIGLGGLARRGALSLSLSAHAALPAAATARRLQHRLELAERALLLSIGAHLAAGRFELGARVAGGLRLVDASGTTAEQTRREVSFRSVAVRLGPSVRFGLLPQLALELWLGVELEGEPRSYRINGVEVARAGLLNPFATLAIAVDAI